jgi:ABC-type sulfate transport system substrate-binding protein
MKRIWLALLVTMTLALGVVAHGDKKHVSGTVEKINTDSIVVKSKDGSSIVVKLASTTIFIRRSGNTDKSAKAEDLAVGDLVVIHASPKDTGLEADQVKFSSRGDRGVSSGTTPR